MSNFYGELLIRITSDTAGLSKGLQSSAAQVNAASKSMEAAGHKASRSWERVGLGMQNVGRTMSQFVTIPIAAGFAFAAYSGYKYSKALLQIRNLTGLTADETERYGSAMLDMSKYGIGPQKLAEAMYFISSSGFKAAEALKVLDVAAKASASGMGEIQPVADVLTSAMNAYGHSNLSAARATDILMKTIQVGKAEPEALAASLGRIMPVAAKLGVPLGQVGGAIAGLTLTGLSAAEAVTSLRGTMIALAAPAKMSIEELGRLGLSYQQVTRSIKDKGLLATMQMLYEKTDGNMLAMRKIIPNVRALNGVLSLLGPNYKKNVEITKAVIDSNGKLAESFAATAATPIQKFRVAIASIQASFIKMGIQIMPTVASIVSQIGKVFDAFGRLDSTTKGIILWGAVVVAALGPIVMIAGSVIRSIALMKSAFVGLSAMKLFGGAAAASEIGAGTAAIATATAATNAAVAKGAAGRIAAVVSAQAAQAAGIRAIGTAAASAAGPIGLFVAGLVAATAAAVLFAKHELDPTGENWKRNTKALGDYLGLLDTVQKRTVEVPVKLVMKGGSAKTNLLRQQGVVILTVNDVKAWGSVNRLRDYIKNPGRWVINLSAHLSKPETVAEIAKNIKDLGAPLAAHKVRLAADIDHENLLKGLEIINMTQKIPPIKVPLDIKMGLASKSKINKWFNSLSKPQQLIYTLQVRDEQAVDAMKTVKHLSGRLSSLQAQKTTPEVRAEIKDVKAKLKVATAELLRVGGMTPTPTVNANIAPALTEIGKVTYALMNLRDKTVTVKVNREGGAVPDAEASGSVQMLRGPKRFLAGEAGPEIAAFFPLNDPNRSATLLDRLNTMMGQGKSVPASSPGSGGGGSQPAQINVVLPGGTCLVGTARDVAKVLAPHVGAASSRVGVRQQRGRV